MDQTNNSKVLRDEQPLMIPPKLASIIGLNEAIVLQQVHYWNQINKDAGNNFKNGYHWTFNSYKSWKEQSFPFWSEKKVERLFIRLESLRLLVSGNFNKMSFDRTKWYRINYEALAAIETFPLRQIDVTNTTKWRDHLDKMTCTIPETTPEITSETNRTLKGVNSASELTPCVTLFFDLYEKAFGEEHPYIKIEKLREVSEEIEIFMGENDLGLDEMTVIIRKYFNTPFDGCDYNICHFASRDIMLNRFYEELY